jgi:hypothetical protein
MAQADHVNYNSFTRVSTSGTFHESFHHSVVVCLEGSRTVLQGYSDYVLPRSPSKE